MAEEKVTFTGKGEIVRGEPAREMDVDRVKGQAPAETKQAPKRRTVPKSGTKKTEKFDLKKLQERAGVSGTGTKADKGEPRSKGGHKAAAPVSPPKAEEPAPQEVPEPKTEPAPEIVPEQSPVPSQAPLVEEPVPPQEVNEESKNSTGFNLQSTQQSSQEEAAPEPVTPEIAPPRKMKLDLGAFTRSEPAENPAVPEPEPAAPSATDMIRTGPFIKTTLDKMCHDHALQTETVYNAVNKNGADGIAIYIRTQVSGKRVIVLGYGRELTAVRILKGGLVDASDVLNVKADCADIKGVPVASLAQVDANCR